MKFIAFLITSIPIIVLGTFIYKKDRNKEPITLLFTLFVVGIISALISILVRTLLENYVPLFAANPQRLGFFELFIYTFLGIALVEELSKFIVVVLVGFNSREFDESYDIIVYSTFAAIGFAFFENILYITHFDFTFAEAFLRGILAVAIHICDGAILGYFLAQAKQNKGFKRVLLLILGLFITVLVHGTYNFLIYISNIYSFLNLVIAIFVIFVYLIAYYKTSELAKNNKKI